MVAATCPCFGSSQRIGVTQWGRSVDKVQEEKQEAPSEREELESRFRGLCKDLDEREFRELINGMLWTRARDLLRARLLLAS